MPPVFKWGYWFATKGWFGVREMCVYVEMKVCRASQWGVGAFPSPSSRWTLSELEVWTGLRALRRDLVLSRLQPVQIDGREHWVREHCQCQKSSGWEVKVCQLAWAALPTPQSGQPSPQPSPLITLPLIEFLFFFSFFFLKNIYLFVCARS